RLARLLRHLRTGSRRELDDLVDLFARTHVVRQRDAGERAGPVVVDTGVVGQLGEPPEHDRLTPRLEEDRVLHLLAVPTELLVERTRPCDVGDSERDEADSLIHGTTVPIRTLRPHGTDEFRRPAWS